jgi:membrane protease YdiL (CAAX protease family)
MLRAAAPASAHIGSGFGIGLIIGGLGSLAAGLVLARRRKSSGPVALGDIAPLMPRNGAEMVHTGLLSVSAGVGEELYFRLLLPLLMIGLGAPPLFAFVAATAIFGLAHLYQGWVGVVATTVVGAVMTAIYLGSGALVLVIALHIGLDFFGLVIRPAFSRLVSPREA